jgi:hypothetical protein
MMLILTPIKVYIPLRSIIQTPETYVEIKQLEYIQPVIFCSKLCAAFSIE